MSFICTFQKQISFYEMLAHYRWTNTFSALTILSDFKLRFFKAVNNELKAKKIAVKICTRVSMIVNYGALCVICALASPGKCGLAVRANFDNESR